MGSDSTPDPQSVEASRRKHSVAERPKSTVAQIVQSTVTVCIFMLGVFGYFYTVRPVYTKQRAEEQAAKLQREIATYETSLTQYRRQLRPYVIDQYTKRVLTSAAALLSYVEIVSNMESGVGSSSWTEAGSAEDLYDTRGIATPEGRPTLPRNLETGRDVVLMNLKSPELNLLDELERSEVTKRIQKSVDTGSAFSEPLVFRRSEIVFPRRVDYIKLSNDERKNVRGQVDKERKRQRAAHVAFIKAMDEMRLTLRE